MAGDGGQGDQIGVVAPADLVVQRVDGSGVDADQDLARLRHGFGDVAQFEGLRAAKGGEDEGFHWMAPYFGKTGYREFSI